MTLTIKFRRLAHAAGLPLPSRATVGSAGIDLAAAQEATVWPGRRVRIPTGFAVEVPSGAVGLICPRSGLAATHGITVLNAPGILDSDFRGEVGVILHNAGDLKFTVDRGDRIAQLVIVPMVDLSCVETDELSDTSRVGGFGSTGR